MRKPALAKFRLGRLTLSGAFNNPDQEFEPTDPTLRFYCRTYMIMDYIRFFLLG